MFTYYFIGAATSAAKWSNINQLDARQNTFGATLSLGKIFRQT